ncbi:MAG: hypothetical protein ABF242_03330, partial [Flavobacteriales bacterium]
MGVFSQDDYFVTTFPGKTVESSTSPQVELYACEAIPENYAITIKNISPFTLSLCTLEINLPSGINYAGNFNSVAAVNFISNTDSNILLSLDSVQTLVSLPISFDIVAGCGVFDLGVARGNFDVKLRAEFTQKNTGARRIRNWSFAPLIVNFPKLQIAVRSFTDALSNINYIKSPAIGDEICRRITITNGGTSPLDSVFFTSNHSPSIQLVSYSLGTVTGTAISHAISFAGADFSSIGNMDGFLDPGEDLVFFECIRIIDCIDPTTTYDAFWGCGTDICQIETATDNIVFETSSPRLSVTPSVDTPACYGVNMPFTAMRLRIKNERSNLIDSAQDISVEIFQGVNGFSPNFLSVINSGSIRVRQNGNLIPFTIISTTPNNSALCNAAGANSVGRFKILIPKIYADSTVQVAWRVETCCNTSCNNGNLSVYDWGYNVEYQNRCEVTYREHVGRVGLNNQDLRHQLAPGASTSQVTSASPITDFEFAIVNSYFSIPKDASDFLRYEIEIPQCMDFVRSTANVYLENFDGTRISATLPNIVVTGKTIDVKFLNGFYDLTQGKIVIKLTPNCTSCTPNPVDTISIRSFYNPNDGSCSSCEFELGCASIPVSILCNPNCGAFNIQYRGGRSYFQRAQASFGYPDDN